jgi:dihydrofolate reductase
MRRIVVSEFVTIDGVMESPDRWVPAFWSPDAEQFKLREILSADGLLLGRMTYEGFAAAWPDRSDPDGFADRMNGIAKHVVSSTLMNPAWSNTSVMTGDPATEVARLKETTGGDIVVAGSASLVNLLLKSGLADEYRLMIFPTIAGRGKRLFSVQSSPATLELRGITELPHGVAVLSYVPATAEPGGVFPEHFKHDSSKGAH